MSGLLKFVARIEKTADLKRGLRARAASALHTKTGDVTTYDQWRADRRTNQATYKSWRFLGDSNTLSNTKERS